jgi:hypothetical protein
MLTNRLYAGVIHVQVFGVSRRGDFQPLVSEETFYRVQAILEGRVHVIEPHQRSRPDFPLKGLVRCEAYGRALTASWSKGRNGSLCVPPLLASVPRCQYQQIQTGKGCSSTNWKQLQPTAGYMRLVKEYVLRA